MSETLNIVQLIEENPLNKLTKPYQNRLLNKIKESFSTEEQKLFIASFYCYLNYKNDEYVIDLDNIWKWLGFSQKIRAKELLENNFKQDIDYKIVFSEKRKNPKGGRPSEKIMLNIKTFKKMCMKANTKKSNDIHEYYIKLEETLHEVIDEESTELRKDLQFKEYLLDKKTVENKKLENQLEKKHRKKYEFTNRVYIVSNPSINDVDRTKNYYKIGKSGNMNNRLGNYCSGAPLDYKVEYSRLLCSKREESAIEGLMLCIFDNYRCINEIESKREWMEGINIDILKSELDILVNFLEERKKFYDSEFRTKDELKYNTLEIENEDMDENLETEKHSGSEYCMSESENEPNNFEDIDSNEETLEPEQEPEPKPDPVDPRDFDRFISECCIVDKENPEHFTPKSDIREAYRMWSNCIRRDVKNDFESYLVKNFNSGATFIGKSRRTIYRGIKVKELTFTPSDKNLDFEQFIVEKCKVNYHNRISYVCFYEHFEKYKKETQPDYKLDKDYKKVIKKYLNNKFLAGRVYISTVEKSLGLHGVYGIGVEENNFGIKVPPRKNKRVGQYSFQTKELLNTFDSVILASDKLKIPFSSLGNYIRFGSVINDKIYKFLDPDS